jgi:hypothetical protein
VPESDPPTRPPASRWTSFVADPDDPRPRILAEDGNPVHRLRAEHNRDTVLVHLGDEDGKGWTVMAVDRATRRCGRAGMAPGGGCRGAFSRLYG